MWARPRDGAGMDLLDVGEDEDEETGDAMSKGLQAKVFSDGMLKDELIPASGSWAASRVSLGVQCGFRLGCLHVSCIYTCPFHCANSYQGDMMTLVMLIRMMVTVGVCILCLPG